MVEGLKFAGCRPQDVRFILLTHWHNDHSSGAEALRLLSGAEVYYSALEADHFTDAAPNLAGSISKWIPERGLFAKVKGILGQAPTRPVQATRKVREGEVLAGGIRVLETPGHSEGHLSYDFHEEGVLFTGDALAISRGRISYMSRFLTKDLASARVSMRRCLEIDARILCPGHRAPLLLNVASERRRALEEIESGKAWPLFS
jgi:glyoxylase-like metal-dependent hydrolase (beta-lactamase superfamily II)